MARPRKEAGEKRDELLNFRLTTAELEHLRAQADAAALSLSDYVRKRALGHVVTPLASKADAALISEINRVGVNVNQLAKAVHMDDRRFVPDWRFVLTELRQVLQKVSAGYGA